MALDIDVTITAASAGNSSMPRANSQGSDAVQAEVAEFGRVLSYTPHRDRARR